MAAARNAPRPGVRGARGVGLSRGAGCGRLRAMFTLRHRDADLIRFDWLPDRGGRQEVRVDRVFPAAKKFAPIELRANPTDEALGRWLRGRTVPANRAYVRNFLAKQGLSERDPRGILAVSRGLSLQDVFWIAEDGFPGRWADVNFYENPFSRVLAWLAFTGYGSYVRTSVRSSPEYTTNGALPKCWRRVGGNILLFKGGSEGAANAGREPQSEFHAAQVAAALGVPHVAYGLARFKGRLCSTCPLFTSQKVSFVPFARLTSAKTLDELEDFLRGFAPALLPDLRRILVFDALVRNEDRHLGNVGLLVDNATNESRGLAPAFDHGLSLFPFAMEDDLANLDRYAAARRPVLYPDFDGAAAARLTPALRTRLRSLAASFRFARHPRLDLPAPRLRALESFVRATAARLSESRPS